MDLIAELEYIIGQCCFNPNIKNFSGDVELDDGRWFRYPLTVELSNGKQEKWKRKLNASALTTPERFTKAHYSSAQMKFILFTESCAQLNILKKIMASKFQNLQVEHILRKIGEND